MQTKLILIRHGQSQANLENRFAGHFDFPLTALGHTQARRTADYLKDIHIDAVIASDLSRAMETAKPIADDHGLAILPDPAFRELYFGELEGARAQDIVERYPHYGQIWKEDFSAVCCPGGESIAALIARVKAALARTVKEYAGKTVCIVSHGAALRAMRSVWDGREAACIGEYPFAANASVSVVLCDDAGDYTVETYGYDAHLSDILTTVHDKF